MKARRPLARVQIVAVITGDVIRSTELAKRAALPGLLEEAFKAVGGSAVTLVRPFETYRGDSFQGVVRAPDALWVAALIRARLRAHYEESGGRRGPIDARIAIGVGGVDRPAARVAISDGEAFRLSGRALDELGADSSRRLALALAPEIAARKGEIAVALLDELIRRFDDIVGSWSVAAAGSVFCHWAEELTQAEVAQRLGITQPAVSQRLRSARAEEARRIVTLFERALAADLEE